MKNFNITTKIRKIVYATLVTLDQLLARKQTKIVTLCYHSFDTSDWRFAVPPGRFEKQMKHMLSLYQPIALGDINQLVRNRKVISQPSFAVTFDDGYASVWQLRHICQKLGIKPTVFVLANPNHANRQELKSAEKFLTIDQIKELHRLGWEIGCHSATHPDFSALSPQLAEKEVRFAKARLEKKLGFAVNYFAYPRGRYDQTVLAAVNLSAYKLGLTMDDGEMHKEVNPYQIPRIGVDGSHDFTDFKNLFSPSVVQARKLIRQSLLGDIYEKSI